MRETDAIAEARREMEICNACRYCEGFCAVFPAMELHREFAAGDLGYLANLCHNCRGCYYACQYAPPHEWGINLPRTFAEVRAESYEHYAWPPRFAQAFQRNGLVVALATALGFALVLGLGLLFTAPGALSTARPVLPGAFYAVIPLWIMQVVALATAGFTLYALARGFRNYWAEAGIPGVGPRAIARALHDIFTLRNLGGAGHGCNDGSERFSMTRRYLHHAMFYGFLLCFVATTAGFIDHSFLGLAAPYPFFSLPVLAGTLGGIGLLIGTVGLFAMKLIDDPMPAARRMLAPDIALLVLLALIAGTGLELLLLRATNMMGLLLCVHLGFVLALFVILPYSKMVHGLYRAGALLRAAIERDLPRAAGGE
ncbi:MAG: tricarballylate utilization 4Fe-4S protein TcuB [Rhodospirillales bacterium]|nr:tricarballylate utilization 4Fe-4S protein TcuB [Rhodospirillales bacterium]